MVASHTLAAVPVSELIPSPLSPLSCDHPLSVPTKLVPARMGKDGDVDYYVRWKATLLGLRDAGFGTFL
jgi:hypothetical protein